MVKTDLSNADLSNIILIDTDLSVADKNGTLISINKNSNFDLSQKDLSNMNLKQINFLGLDISEKIFKNSKSPAQLMEFGY